MVNVWVVFVVVCVAASCKRSGVLAEDDRLPVVSTSYGPVQGIKERSSWTNKTMYSFRGIPYASPPVGNLRFKDPIPPSKWTSVRNCSVDGPACLQSRLKPPAASEDCLFVNVYSPQINPDGVLLPVMVWVHGGGFITGSGQYKLYGPDLLVGQGVVVVTLNYRLGALGFLTLGTREVSGNAGLKDQRLALQWVQSEIHQFGGDPREVTLFGESAGSISVHLHYLSPLSTGLFNRAIGQSAVNLNISVKEVGPQYGMKLAELLNCSPHDTQTALKCMLGVEAEEITTTQALVTGTPEDPATPFGTMFLPTVDGEISDNPFLPEPPMKLMREKQGSSVPFIIGVNSDEGMFILTLGSVEDRLNIINNLEDLLPTEVRLSSSKERLAELKDKMKHYYFKGSPPAMQNIGDCVKLYSDSYFGYYAAQSARYFQKRTDVYLYRYSFNGKVKPKTAESFAKKHKYSGVTHGEELPYIFATNDQKQTLAAGSPDATTWKRMAKMWTNFAKYGKPTVGKDPELQNVTWLPLKEASTRYLEIGVDLTMVNTDFLEPNVALWDNITPSSSSSLKPTFTVMSSFAVLLLVKQVLYG